MTEPKAKVPPARWEYYVHTQEVKGGLFRDIRLGEGIAAELNDLGKSGWELVNAFDLNIYEGRSGKVIFVFKRRIP